MKDLFKPRCLFRFRIKFENKSDAYSGARQRFTGENSTGKKSPDSDALMYLNIYSSRA
jgi:hypothetical protein